ncbi:hypothetical protein SETIT_2G168300v2 [Setaria italica]|uniref:Uncharacterized protein n=1 Tax=Setaria italica TaxID=4555 RepID=A0A368PZZ0_SETIT|nr:hypothetical protein SETIT_2G168300v2 [Setaria italica]
MHSQKKKDDMPRISCIPATRRAKYQLAPGRCRMQIQVDREASKSNASVFVFPLEQHQARPEGRLLLTQAACSFSSASHGARDAQLVANGERRVVRRE